MYCLLRAALNLAAVVLFFQAAPLLAHDGHDHNASAPAPISSVAPRAEATSETHELVAVARGGVLAIYLDRFPTNEPVDGATIDVETPAGPQAASGKSGEPYRLDAPWSGNAGSYDLIFTIATDGNIDILPLTLIIPRNDTGGKAAATGWLSTSAIAGDVWQRIGHDTPGMLIALLGGFAAGIGAMLLLRRRGRAAIVLALTATLVLFNGPSHAHDGDDHSQLQFHTCGISADSARSGSTFSPMAACSSRRARNAFSLSAPR